MPLYDSYAPYREPLSIDEQSLLAQAEEQAQKIAKRVEREANDPNGYKGPQAKKDEPVFQAHTGLATDRAWKQLRLHDTTPVPEDADVGVRFPGIDPVGKHSIIEMKFAQREAVLKEAVQFLTPQAREFIQGFQQQQSRSGFGLNKITQDMKHDSEMHSAFTRASKLCMIPEGREQLHQKARLLEAGPPVVAYDKMLQGLEHLAGIRKGPMPKEIEEFCTRDAHMDIPPNLKGNNRDLSQRPAGITVDFQNLENKLLHKQLSDPRNWGKKKEDLPDIVDVENLPGQIPPYARATADRTISQAFGAIESEKPWLNRADLLLIDGKTVRERLKEGGVDAPTPDQLKAASAEMTASALMAGKRVEAFLPDKDGKLPAEPTPITKTGYEPSPVKKVVLNAWEKYFSQRGFYKEKTAQAEEYKRTMDGRQRVQKAGAIRYEAEQRYPRVAGVLQEIKRMEDGKKEQFFGKLGANQPVHNENLFRSNRSAHASFCMAYLAEKNYPLKDIVDPTKLIQEKETIGQAYRDHANRNGPEDQAWYCKHMVSGQKALTDKVNQLTQQTDFRNEQDVLNKLPTLQMASHAAYDLRQELGMKGFQTQLRPFLGPEPHPQLEDAHSSSFAMKLLEESYRAQVMLHDAKTIPTMKDGSVDEKTMRQMLGCSQSTKPVLQKLAEITTPNAVQWPEHSEYGIIMAESQMSQEVTDAVDAVKSVEQLQQIAPYAMAQKLNEMKPINGMEQQAAQVQPAQVQPAQMGGRGM